MTMQPYSVMYTCMSSGFCLMWVVEKCKVVLSALVGGLEFTADLCICAWMYEGFSMVPKNLEGTWRCACIGFREWLVFKVVASDLHTWVWQCNLCWSHKGWELNLSRNSRVHYVHIGPIAGNELLLVAHCRSTLGPLLNKALWMGWNALPGEWVTVIVW